MSIEFFASVVEYREALDGEIVQVSFQGYSEQDPLKTIKLFFSISQNYEFPGKPTLEWFDGKNQTGGAEVFEYNLTSSLFELKTMDDLVFRIRHNCPKKVLTQIQDFLKHEFR